MSASGEETQREKIYLKRFKYEEHSYNRMCGNAHGSHIMQGTGQYPVAETKHGQQGDVDAGFAEPTLYT